MRDQLRFSVVIVTDGRAAALANTLTSLQHLDYPGFEVCVVHGPTPDGTKELLESWRGRVKIASQPARNMTAARNIGIALAAGEIVAFLDDDAIPEPEWLRDLAAAFDAPSVGGAGGFAYDQSGVTFQTRYVTLDRLGTLHDRERATPELNFPLSAEIPHLLGTNCSFRRDALIGVGGFDEQIGRYLDESDVCFRMVDAGWELRQVAAAYVHHKLLPDALRTEQREIRAWYPLIKNKLYVPLVNGRHHHGVDAIIADARVFVTAWRNNTERAIEQGRLPAEDRQRFDEEVERAWRDGLRAGLARDRRLIGSDTLRRHAAPFLPFPTLAPAGGRKTFCLLTQDYPPARQGESARYVHQLARCMAARGHHVHVLTRGRDKDQIDVEDSVWVHRIVPRASDPPAIVGAPRIPQVIWSHAATTLREIGRIADHRPVDAVYAPLSDCEGLAVEVDGHMADFATPMPALEKRLLERSTGIHAISAAIASDVARTHGAPNDVTDRLIELLSAAARSHPWPAREAAARPASPRRIYYFVNHTANLEGNSGIQRVARYLGHALCTLGRDVVFVSWRADSRAATRSTDDELRRLARWHGPPFRPQGAAGEPLESAAADKDHVAGSWLIVPELPYHGDCATRDLIDYAHRVGMRIAFIFYDLIPIKLPGYEHLREPHAAYVEQIASADLIVPISRHSGTDLERYFARTLDLSTAELPQTTCCPLPEEVPGHPRRQLAAAPAKSFLDIVSLGVIEPRKNQSGLMRAFNRFCDSNPGLDVRLTLVGDRYPEELREVAELARGNPRITFAGPLGDDDVVARYGQCDFTVFPSIEEGFGLPIAESLWFGVPCLCADFGAMAEVAAAGGCLTVDTRSTTALAAGIERLSTDAALRQRLAREAAQRPMRSWRDYASAVLKALDDHVPTASFERAIEVMNLKRSPEDARTEEAAGDGVGSQPPAQQPAKSAPGRIRSSMIVYTFGQVLKALRGRSLAPLRDWRGVRAIARSGMFDRAWYLEKNPDVAAAGVDPIRHYVAFGAREGRDPSSAFDGRQYLEQNPDVGLSGIDPLSHFIRFGAAEGRTFRPTAPAPQPTLRREAPADGLCIIGHLCSEIGLGEAARSLAAACDTQRLPLSFRNLPLPDRNNVPEFATKCTQVADRKANLLVTGLPALRHLESEIWPGRVNILYPFWELSRVPAEWLALVRRCDEIWAPSTFVAAAFPDTLGRPVRLIHQPVRLPPAPPPPRSGRETLRFFTYLDFDSYGARKNPGAAVSAFQAAFDAAKHDVELIVKGRGIQDRGLRQRLAEAAATDVRIRIIDRTLDRAQMDRLMATCDVFISLHRSEGFGFGPAEALAAGRAVVSTDYSGTTDFITPATGYPVACTLEPVQPGEYVGSDDQVWATPQQDSAVAALRSIHQNLGEADARARRGFALLQARHGLAVVGATIAARLRELGVL
jgi:glycosyltransferase involved in cell wall biosynthesis/GT2 family glycosyltransferase